MTAFISLSSTVTNYFAGFKPRIFNIDFSNCNAITHSTMKKLLSIPCIIMIFSCFGQAPQVITLTGEKDLIPEGIAVEQDKIFVSSIFKNKILQYDVTTHEVSDFIRSNQYGFKTGVGLFAKDNLLFALCNDSSTSSLFVFAIKEKKLLINFSS